MYEQAIHRLNGTTFHSRLYSAASRASHVHGQRDPVVFVSGAFQTMDSWRGFAEHFAPERPVLLVDLPGTGASEPLDASVGLEFLAHALVVAVTDLGFPRVHLVCASYGTAVGYRFAQQRPQQVASLTLGGVAPRLPDHLRDGIEECVASIEQGDLERFARRAIDGLLRPEEDVSIVRRAAVHRVLSTQLRRMSVLAQRQYVQNTKRLLQSGSLDLANAPWVRATVFTGEHDHFTPPEHGRAVATSIPGATFTTLKDADHLFHLERPEATLRLIEQTVREEPIADSPELNRVCRTGAQRTPPIGGNRRVAA